MGCISSTTNADVVRAHGTGRSAFPLSKPTEQQRRSGSGNKAAGAGVQHHPQSRNAPRDSLGGGSGGGNSGNGVVKAGSSLSSDENSRHVQRLLASLSLLQSLPTLYPWYIAQPPLPHVQLSYAQHMWQSIRLGSHELYARVREADPACTPTLVFFEVFSADLLARCPALHVHLFGSAPLTHHNKPSLSSKLCSLVQTTLSSFAAPSHRKTKRSHNQHTHNHSGVFDSVSDCGSEEASTSERAGAASANSRDQQRAERETIRERERDSAAAAERKQRMASLWRLFHSAGINCEALGPFFTAIQNALCQCFGAEWTQPAAQAWGALCSSVIEQMIGVETTGAGPTMTAAPTGSSPDRDRDRNGQSGQNGQSSGAGASAQQPHAALSVMASPRSNTHSAGGAADTTDTVSRTHTTHLPAASSSKPSAPLKAAGHKQRLDLNSTVSRSGAGYSSDAYSPRRGVGSPTTAGRTLNAAGPSSAYAPGAATLSLPLAQPYTGPLASAHQQPLSLSIASPFSQAHAAGPLSGGSTAPSTTGTPVRRLPSALTSLAAAASSASQPAALNLNGPNTVQSVSLGLTPMIQLPGQTPSPSTPAVAGAAATMAAEADGVCRVATSGGSGEADSDDEFDALTAEAVAAQMADPATLEAMRATAQLDPAQELARFAFHPKPPQKPRVVYMSGLELPPASVDPNAPQSVALARAYAVNGRSLFGRSRHSHAPAPAGATASELTALALLTASNANAAAARAAAAAQAAASVTVSFPPIAGASADAAYGHHYVSHHSHSHSLASASSNANANAIVPPHPSDSFASQSQSQSHGHTHLPAIHASQHQHMPLHPLPHAHAHPSAASSAHNLSLLSRGSILGAIRSATHSSSSHINSSSVAVSAY